MSANIPSKEQLQVAQQVAPELRPQPEQLTPPEQSLDQGQQIEAKKGLGERALGRLGMDEESLKEAGVLRANQAQAAETTARGIAESNGLSQDAQRRAYQIKAVTPEHIEPVNKRPL